MRRRYNFVPLSNTYPIVPEHKDLAYSDDPLPRYSELDPLHSHGTEAEDDQSHERVRLLVEHDDDKEGERKEKSSALQASPATTQITLKPSPTQSSRTLRKISHYRHSKEGLPRGTLVMSRSSTLLWLHTTMTSY